MRANESLALSLLATAAVALPSPSGTGKSCKAGHKHKQLAQHNSQVADLQAQISSLRQQISSVYAEPNHACKASATGGDVYGTVPAGFTGAFTAALRTGAASATLPAAYHTYFSNAGPMTRLNPESTSVSPTSSVPKATGGPGKTDGGNGGEAPSSYASGARSSSNAPAPYPTLSTYSNGTTVNHWATGASTGAHSSATPLWSSGAVSSATSSSSSSSSTSTSAGVSPTYIPKLSDWTADQISSGEAWKNVSQIANQRMKARELKGSCTYETAEVRTEFRAMSKEKRKEFTDAVTCLKNLPPKVVTADQSSEYAGVKSRYDEYVATHIENSYKIHATANFLAWHRHYIFSFAEDLKNSCGYTGTLPYWDWAADAHALDQSEVFNGDEYSMGGNGEYIAGRNDTYLGLQDINFPPGTGGGCVYSGPFSNTTFVTNLGPIDSPYNDNVKGHYDFNPRCLVRDLNTWFSSRYNTYNNVADLAIGVDSIEYFQSLMQGYLGDNNLGVHGGGHWLGGGPSQLEDFHSSPNDPIFYLHHAMLDRIWTVWQYMDRENRQNAIYGTSTLDNNPPSADMTLTEKLPFGFVAESPVFGDLMDTLAGPYCYRYE